MEKISRRYCRHNEVLGRGSCKTVYRAFDRTEGIEVAWNQVDLLELGFNPTQCNPGDLDKLIEPILSEAQLLRNLHHKNIIRCYDAWFDKRHNTMNFITELCTSGTLREYRERYGHVDEKVLRSWARQILQGLVYLHGRNPPIAHRDLKCDNLFINGNTGELKIGDLGEACVMQAAKNVRRSVTGTPGYMAPEILDGNYSELVDVYSFGMCVLEMVTVERPYRECMTVAETFKRIREGKKPQALKRVKDSVARDLIEKCFEPQGRRPSASVLLNHQFFQKPECSDVLMDQSALKKPIEGARDVGVEWKSAATKAPKSSPPGRGGCHVVFVGDDVSYRGSPGTLEGFDIKEMEIKFKDMDMIIEGVTYGIQNTRRL